MTDPAGSGTLVIVAPGPDFVTVATGVSPKKAPVFKKTIALAESVSVAETASV